MGFMETTADLIHANSTGGVASRVLAVLSANRGEFVVVRTLAKLAQAPEALVLLALRSLAPEGVNVGNVGGPDVAWLSEG